MMTDLARVGTTNLDGHILGIISPTGFNMFLGISLGLERLLAFWALIV